MQIHHSASPDLVCRELYKHKENGELKPGQKGLALTAEQWAALAAAMPAIDAALVWSMSRDLQHLLALHATCRDWTRCTIALHVHL